MEEDGVLVHVLQEILPRGHAVGVEPDAPVRVIQVQHRVQRVVIEFRLQAVKHSNPRN